MNADRPYLEHIREAIRWIATYTADGREAFMQMLSQSLGSPS